MIDGEVVTPSADGATDFSVLQNELKGKSPKIVMVAFDLLYLNGHDSPLTIPAHLHAAVMQLSPEQRRDRKAVNEAVRLADPDAQR
jgi:bifunctional non-homologous end joining protein LigD